MKWGTPMRMWIMALALGLATAAASAASADPRADGWRADINVARTEFLAKDRSFSPASRAAAERRLARLAARIERLNDQQVVSELARIAASSGNAHTRAYLLRNRGYWRRWPIRIWRFSDGYRVVAVREGQEALLGARVVRLAGRPIEDVARTLRPLYAGNDNWADYMATYTLTSPDALIGAGLLKGDGAVVVDGVRDGRRVSLRLAAEAFTPRNGPEESWWFLSPAHPAVKGWVQVLAGAPLPAYLAHPADNYRYSRCRGGVAYFQFYRAQSAPDEKLDAFGKRVLADLAADPPARLVVDLRFNTGGDLSQAQPLFKALSASPIGRERGRLYVVVGPTTFSAGISHAAWLKQDSQAAFVGSEPGDGLETWAEGGNVVLPHSGLVLHYADRAHRYSKRPIDIPRELVWLDLNIDNLKPDRPARLSFQDYAAGRDPAAQAIGDGELACP